MNRTISAATLGYVTNVGPELRVRRVLPAAIADRVGPFVFLDLMMPRTYPANPNGHAEMMGAHPHKGFVTFTYLFEGELEHIDSIGNHAYVGDGGGQWMLAGSGIIHDGKPTDAFLQRGGTMRGFQLWINIPAAHKLDPPAYLNLTADRIPETTLPDGAGTLRVVIGSYGEVVSPVPIYSPMFVYHLRLAANATASIKLPKHFELAVCAPEGTISIEGMPITKSALALLPPTDPHSDTVTVTNEENTALDVMLFGGAAINEPMVAHGPFVMNTEAEIRTAYHEFNTGKFGVIQSA